jgi:hypothetical protein
MGFGSLLGLAKLFTGAAPQPSTIEREIQQPPTTPLEQEVNALLPKTSQQDLKQQLHATVEPDPLKAVVVSDYEKLSNEKLLDMAKERAKENPELRAAMLEMAIPDDGIKIGISKKTIQELLTFVEPFLRDFKGNFDKFLSKPFDKPTTGIELMEKFFSIPLARKILDATGNYMGELSSKAAVLHPEQTQAATVPTPA